MMVGPQHRRRSALPRAWARGLTGKGVTVAVLDSGKNESSHRDLPVVTRAGGEQLHRQRHRRGHHRSRHALRPRPSPAPASTRASWRMRRCSVARCLTIFGGGRESWDHRRHGVGRRQRRGRLHEPGLKVQRQPRSQVIIHPWRSTGSPRQTGTLFVVASGNSGDVYRHPSRRRRRAHRRRGGPRQQARLRLLPTPGPRLNEQRGQARHHRPWCSASSPRRRATASGGKLVGDQHVAMTGTSMASPHVAGAAAILAGQHPQWKATDLKAALMNSANPESERDRLRTGCRPSGRGRKAGEKAPSPPAVSTISRAGPQWPHHDDKPTRTTITYRNCGSWPTSRSTWP